MFSNLNINIFRDFLRMSFGVASVSAATSDNLQVQ